jgi:hypothetical protein
MPGKVGRPLSLAGSIGARTPNFAVDPTVSVWVLMVSQLEPQQPWPERTQTFTDDSVHKALNPIRPL